jgi:hypothetical protein
MISTRGETYRAAYTPPYIGAEGWEEAWRSRWGWEKEREDGIGGGRVDIKWRANTG